jgi:hypothetical protein
MEREVRKRACEEQLVEAMKKPRESLTFIHALALPREPGRAEYPFASSGDQEAGAGVFEEVIDLPKIILRTAIAGIRQKDTARNIAHPFN